MRLKLSTNLLKIQDLYIKLCHNTALKAGISQTDYISDIRGTHGHSYICKSNITYFAINIFNFWKIKVVWCLVLLFSVLKTAEEAGNAANGQKKLSFNYTWKNVHTAAAVEAPQRLDVHWYALRVLWDLLLFIVLLHTHTLIHLLTHLPVLLSQILRVSNHQLARNWIHYCISWHNSFDLISRWLAPSERKICTK